MHLDYDKQNTLTSRIYLICVPKKIK